MPAGRAGFDFVSNQKSAARRAVSGERHASGLTIPLDPLGMATIERKNDSWRKPAGVNRQASGFGINAAWRRPSLEYPFWKRDQPALRNQLGRKAKGNEAP
jgi:hypothetical protein